jgi:serine/threonine-protein kinase
VLLFAAIVAAALLLAWALGDDSADPAGSAQTSQPSPTEQPSEPTTEPTTGPTSEPTQSPTSEPTTEEPETVTIDEDDYIGDDRKDVEKELKELGLKPKGEEIENDGTHEEGEVASVEPDGTLEEGSEVTVSWYGKPPEDDEPVDDLTDGGPGNSDGDGSADGNNGEGNG